MILKLGDLKIWSVGERQDVIIDLLPSILYIVHQIASYHKIQIG